MRKKKVVIAYSGDIYSSVALRLLVDAGYDVVTVCIDIGGDPDVAEIRTKAIQIGAISSYVLDAKSEFAENYALLTLQAQAFCENKYPFVSSLSRPLIAKKLVGIAEVEKAFAIALGHIDDQRQFETLIKTLNPTLKLLAPVPKKNWTWEEHIEYAKENKIPVFTDLDTPYVVNQNLWGRKCVLTDVALADRIEEVYAITADLVDVPEDPSFIEIEFVQGIPIKVNGQSMYIEDLFSYLNHLAGKHGIGRIDTVENYVSRSKSHTVIECPGAIILLKAHDSLETSKIVEEVAQFKSIISQKLIEIIEEGLWFTPLRNALEAFIKQTQHSIEGRVLLKLHKGKVMIEDNPSSQTPPVLNRLNVACSNSLLKSV